MNRILNKEKEPPTRSGAMLYIFAEGVGREFDYFSYFRKQDTTVSLHITQRPPNGGNNSPTGLYDDAMARLIGTEEKEADLSYRAEIDEVWFVIDTDKWDEKIQELRDLAKARDDHWHVAQSNPSFEVWLYYHYYEQPPGTPVVDWKNYLDTCIPAPPKKPCGFDTRKHPRRLLHAIRNAEACYTEVADGQPNPLCTQVFRLGKRIVSLVGDRITFDDPAPKAPV